MLRIPIRSAAGRSPRAYLVKPRFKGTEWRVAQTTLNYERQCVGRKRGRASAGNIKVRTMAAIIPGPLNQPRILGWPVAEAAARGGPFSRAAPRPDGLRGPTTIPGNYSESGDAPHLINARASFRGQRSEATRLAAAPETTSSVATEQRVDFRLDR